MSAEAIEPEFSSEVIELYGAQALVRRRAALHRTLGEKYIQLNQAEVELKGCIESIILTDQALKELGVDTDALARQLYAAPPDDDDAALF